MAVDKLVDSTLLDANLTSVANAIRAKGGTSAQIAFPTGFVSAVQAIPTGTTPTGTKQISITQNGTTTEDVAAYANAEITVNVQGGGGAISLINEITLSENTQAVQLDIPSGYDWAYVLINGEFTAENWLYWGVNTSSGSAYSTKILQIATGITVANNSGKTACYAVGPYYNGKFFLQETGAPFSYIHIRGYSADFKAGTKIYVYGAKYADL